VLQHKHRKFGLGKIFQAATWKPRTLRLDQQSVTLCSRDVSAPRVNFFLNRVRVKSVALRACCVEMVDTSTTLSVIIAFENQSDYELFLEKVVTIAKAPQFDPVHTGSASNEESICSVDLTSTTVEDENESNYVRFYNLKWPFLNRESSDIIFRFPSSEVLMIAREIAQVETELNHTITSKKKAFSSAEAPKLEAFIKELDLKIAIMKRTAAAADLDGII
jgi:hypothetical protein